MRTEIESGHGIKVNRLQAEQFDHSASCSRANAGSKEPRLASSEAVAKQARERCPADIEVDQSARNRRIGPFTIVAHRRNASRTRTEGGYSVMREQAAKPSRRLRGHSRARWLEAFAA
jgi:hypothetical protein